MKLIFTDESRIYIGRGDDSETFVRSYDNKIYNDNFLVKAKITESFTKGGCTSNKGPRSMTIIKSTVNIEVYIQILDNFLSIKIYISW